MKDHDSTSRRQYNGVLTSCWCGKDIATFVSKTNENPYRRFYRCVVAMQRKHEDHLFIWEDEAFLDEIRMLHVQQKKLEDDVEKWKMMKIREDAHVGCIGTIEWLCRKMFNREE
ncbi:hypothetical protein N665_0152s0040 [Sinapis alba]|nr:hypothetical protein N665_0152s0040 [Sinapis alba]